MALNTELWQNAASGYKIAYSARFDVSASSWLSKTFGTTGTGAAKIWTISTWIKMISFGASVGDYRSIYAAAVNGSTNHVDQLRVNPSGTWGYQRQGGIGGAIIADGAYVLTTDWQHIVLAVDTNQSTDTDRTKMYFNGTLVDDFDGTPNYGAQDYVTGIGQARVQGIGKLVQGTHETTIDAYMADYIFVDGVQHAASKFGETSGGSWVPLEPAEQSITYGTNGFLLEFGTNDALGDDTSGNSNDWTVNAMGTDHQVTDTPTNPA